MIKKPKIWKSKPAAPLASLPSADKVDPKFPKQSSGYGSGGF